MRNTRLQETVEVRATSEEDDDHECGRAIRNDMKTRSSGNVIPASVLQRQRNQSV